MPLLRHRMREMNASLPAQQRLPDEAVSTAALGEMAALGALCLIHIRRDAALMDQLLRELRFLVAFHGPDGAPLALRGAPLLDACLLEAQRLYAPALHFRVTRQVMRAGRYLLPAGRVVACSPYLLHRDRRHYSEPDTFAPKRFLAGAMRPGRSPLAQHYVPFGRGRHADPYLPQLRTLMGACLAHALLHWEMSLSCEGALTDVRWGLTGMACPAGPRWICYRPRPAEQPPSHAEQPPTRRVTRSETRLIAVREPREEAAPSSNSNAA